MKRTSSAACTVLSVFLFTPSNWVAHCLANNVPKITIDEAPPIFSSSRRSFFEHTTAVTATALSSSGIILSPTVTHAEGEAPTSISSSPQQNSFLRPRAPPEALLPITRLKLWFDKAYRLSTTLSSPDKNINSNIQYDTLVKINDVLSNQPKLFYANTPKSQQVPMMNEFMAQLAPAATTNNFPSPPSSASAPLSDFTKSSSSSNRIMSILNQADVQRQWNMLQYTESKLENSNDMRAAFNYYTSRLQFNSNAYKLQASKEDKKRLIREDGGLPTVTTVVVSDLDLRDLYRNLFLTSLDDINAEVSYQLKQKTTASSSSEVDVVDVVELMEKANTALTNWFDLIDPNDIRDAIAVVSKEDSKT